MYDSYPVQSVDGLGGTSIIMQMFAQIIEQVLFGDEMQGMGLQIMPQDMGAREVCIPAGKDGFQAHY